MKNLFNKADDFNRREIVKGMAAGLLGLNIIPVSGKTSEKPISARGGKAKSVIFINAKGGMSHVDSFDIKEANKLAMTQSSPIKTSADGIRVGKYFQNISKQMHHVALINSMFNTQGAHAEAQYLMSTGYEKRGTIIHPHFGAWVSKLYPDRQSAIPAYIRSGFASGSLGGGFFGSRFGALPIPEPSMGINNIAMAKGTNHKTFDQQLSLLKELNGQYAQKVKNQNIDSYHSIYEESLKLMQSKDLEVFDLSKESKETKEAYGSNNFGQSCLLARRLVEKQVPFIEVTHGGWDHHYQLYEHFPEIAPSFDQAVGTLLGDLHSKGLLDSTLVVMATEFGRNPRTNGTGRKHFPTAYTCWMAGGGVKGGQAYGKTDAMGGKIIENKVKVADFNATIAHAMGLDNNHKEIHSSGRPIQITEKGKPVTAIF